MAIRFGTDGIRGHAGQGAITAETAAAVGRSAARWAQDAGTGRVVIGRDTRPSGPMLEDAVSAGVAAAGGEARIAGVLPTAAIAHALAEGLADTGVMITASHNPWPDNGFKVLLPGGRKPDDADAARLEEWIAEPPTLHATGSQLDISRTAAQAYRSALRSAAGDLSALGRRAIAVDLANGAASSMVNFLRDLVPGQTVILGADGGPTNEGVGSEHPEALCAAVVEHGCYAGIAVDGDADRCRLVDGRGEVVAGDALAWLLAYHGKVDALAVTVMSNQGLEASLPGVRVVRTPVGDRHLAAAMRADGLPLGAEESGHVLFADGLVAGDGLLTGLRASSWATARCRASSRRSAWRAVRRFTRCRRSWRRARRGRRGSASMVACSSATRAPSRCSGCWSKAPRRRSGRCSTRWWRRRARRCHEARQHPRRGP